MRASTYASIVFLCAWVANSEPLQAQSIFETVRERAEEEARKRTSRPEAARNKEYNTAPIPGSVATPYLQHLLTRMEAAAGSSLSHSLVLENSAWVQAWVRPDQQRIGVTRGMLNLIQNEAALAALLGHEIGHHQLGHRHDGSAAGRGSTAPGVMGQVIGEIGRRAPGEVGQVLRQQINEVRSLQWSRDNERDADFAGAAMAAKAGYDPYAFVEMFERLASRTDLSTINRLRQNLKGTHDAPESRAARLRERLRREGYVPGRGIRGDLPYQLAFSNLHDITAAECRPGESFGQAFFPWALVFCNPLPAWPDPCAAMDAFPPNLSPVFVDEYRRGRDAHAALSVDRERFANGDMTAAFGALYFHVIDQMLRRVHSGGTTNAAEMQLVNRFYDSWAANRHAYSQRQRTSDVEPHWQSYFEQASDMNSAQQGGSPRVDTLWKLIKSGIDAHIDGDLPRAIRTVWESTPRQDRDELAAAFKASEAIFPPAQDAFFRDLREYTYPHWTLPGVDVNVLVDVPAAVAFVSDLMGNPLGFDVVGMRDRAWTDGSTPGKPLLAKAPQVPPRPASACSSVR